LGVAPNNWQCQPSTGLEKGNRIADLRERLNKRKPLSAQIDTAYLVREERAAP